MLILLQDKMDILLGLLWVFCDEQFNLCVVEWDEYCDWMEMLFEVYYCWEGYQCVDCCNFGGFSSKLSDYFVGDLVIIEILFIVIVGIFFQCQVWQVLCEIFCGQVMYYG